MSQPQHDERLVWVRGGPGRKVVQIIEPAGDLWSVTTEWMENDKLYRRDCEVALARGVAAQSKAQGFWKRLFGG